MAGRVRIGPSIAYKCFVSYFKTYPIVTNVLRQASLSEPSEHARCAGAPGRSGDKSLPASHDTVPARGHVHFRGYRCARHPYTTLYGNVIVTAIAIVPSMASTLHRL